MGVAKANAVGVLRDSSPVIADGDGSVRVWRLADGTPLSHPLDLPEPSWVVALRGNIIVTRGRRGHRHPLATGSMTPYEIASCSAPPADRHDHRIMAGYPVHQATTYGQGPGNRRAVERDSGKLSGTSVD
jgi:hypothetical protein